MGRKHRRTQTEAAERCVVLLWGQIFSFPSIVFAKGIAGCFSFTTQVRVKSYGTLTLTNLFTFPSFMREFPNKFNSLKLKERGESTWDTYGSATADVWVLCCLVRGIAILTLLGKWGRMNWFMIRLGYLIL